ncbi:DUF2797 domain-containing protein [Acinetobacter baumannii]|nr:DUF2797 domain-containing protein [Acinetobacter baumannii]
MVKKIISGISYDKEYRPLLILDDFSNGYSRDYYSLKEGSSITISRMKARYCKGWYDLKTLDYKQCPSGVKLDFDKERCVECASKSKYNPFFDKVSEGALSADQIAYNNQPHIVYLASFGPKLIKIGIANEGRKINRWLDQGAIYACEIAKTKNALIARNIEKLISSSKIVPEAINKKTKISSILRYGCNYDFEEDFSLVIKKIKDIGVEVNASNYQMFNGRKLLDIDFSIAIDMSLNTPIEISGNFVCLVGDFIFLENNGRLLYWKISSIVSHICKIEDSIKDISLNTLF